MIKTITTENAPAAIGPYSQAKLVNGLLFVSGSIPLDPESMHVVGNDITTQTTQVCQNIAAILKAVGIGFDAVVKTTCFLKDMNDFAAFNTVYSEYFTNKPARSCVSVVALPKDVLVEIELIAVVD